MRERNPVSPVALIILDGFGLAPEGPGNAVTLADTPNFDRYWRDCPHTQLAASGLAVGLPEGQIGNSEVGHMNLGAGRVVMQKQTYIQALIDSGDFAKNEVLGEVLGGCKGNTLHFMGLVSDGGVHSDLAHLYALLELASRNTDCEVALHVFTDGRDVGPSTAIRFMEELTGNLNELPGARVASVSGRYYAMDRDKRWDRTERAYNAVVCGESAFTARSGEEAVQRAYNRDETDEFIQPTVVVDEAGRATTVEDGDGIFFFNFRSDRARQLTYALLNEDFDAFKRCRVLRNISYASMMTYAEDIHAPAAFKLPEITRPLAEVLSNAGLKQYHTAETEKYPHVTFFFNAQREDAKPGESRYMEPSPRVATYDLQPEMSAAPLTDRALERLRDHDDAFILLNYANPDMVGHTGVLEAAIKACETADKELGRLVSAVRAKGGAALILADHGNAEKMIAENGGPHTAHTTNPVPFIVVADESVTKNLKLRSGGALGDVAPTVLELLGKNKPPEMTGRSLLHE